MSVVVGMEPQLRRLEAEFSGQVAITYVMAGMSREIAADAKLTSTLDVVAETGVPPIPASGCSTRPAALTRRVSPSRPPVSRA
ncbi:MAG: hypothetical protein ABIO51_00880 [Solirubrobacteraceae bacterium]